MPMPPSAFNNDADTGPVANTPKATVEAAAHTAEHTKITAVEHRSLRALRPTTARTKPAWPAATIVPASLLDNPHSERRSGSTAETLRWVDITPSEHSPRRVGVTPPAPLPPARARRRTGGR